MTTTGQAVGEYITSVPPAVGRRIVAVSRRLAISPPALLRIAVVLIVATSVAVIAVTVQAITDRVDGARGVGAETAPLVNDAEALYVALADADAAASTAYLQAGYEDPVLRTRYQRDLRVAGDRLAAIASRASLSDESKDAIATITRELPIYAGQVELARANSRQNYPVGAAHLRDASSQMQSELLPATTTMYEGAARGLYRDYRRGTALRAPAIIISGLALLLVQLFAAHLLVSFRTRRILNVGLATATLLVLIAGTVSVAMLTIEGNALRSSQRHGADQLLPLSTARILVLQSLSDENLDLIERGTEPGYMPDFKRLVTAIGGYGKGLIGEAATSAVLTGESVAANELTNRMRSYLAAHDDVRLAISRGDYFEAVEIVTGRESAAAAALEKALSRNIQSAARRLDVHAAEARDALDRVALLVAFLVAAGTVFAVSGLVRRVQEYA